MFKSMMIFIFVSTLLGCTHTKNTPSNERAQVTFTKRQQTLYYGGDIITMDGDKPTYVEAVLERDGIIIFAGNKTNAVNNFAGETIEVNLQGKTMLPGFLDPHGHFMSAIMMVNQVNVASPPVGTAKSISQIIEKLTAYQKEKNIPEGGWLVAWGYDQDLLDEQRHITKTDLDAAFPDHKVLIIHVSMHGAVLNSKALQWAKIDASTKTPAGGIIARMPDSNEPAGLIMEMTYIPVMENLPQPTKEEMLELMKPAQMMYTSEGYTQAIEGFTHTKDIDFLMQAAAKGKNFIDIVSLPAFTEMDSWFANPKYKFGEYSNKFKYRPVKSHWMALHKKKQL